MKKVILISLVLVILPCLFVSCSSKKSVDEYELQMEPLKYNSIVDFKNVMIEKILERDAKDPEELTKVDADSFEFYYEPVNLPPNVNFQEIIARKGEYIALVYKAESNSQDTVSEKDKDGIESELISVKDEEIVYVWYYTIDEAGLNIHIRDNKELYKEIMISGYKVYYSETPISETDNTIASRDYLYILEGRMIHVVLPGNIGIENAYKYLFVKKVFY